MKSSINTLLLNIKKPLFAFNKNQYFNISKYSQMIKIKQAQARQEKNQELYESLKLKLSNEYNPENDVLNLKELIKDYENLIKNTYNAEYDYFENKNLNTSTNVNNTEDNNKRLYKNDAFSKDPFNSKKSSLKKEEIIELSKKIKEKNKTYSPIEVLKELKSTELNISEEIKKNRSLNMTIHLFSNKKGNQHHLRGVRKCPGGSEHNPKVCVFTSKPFEESALKAGADYIATAQTYEDIKNKRIDYDVYISSTEVLSQVKLLGRILGPLDLMPSPKLGTAVEPDKLEEAIKGFKSGNKEFKSNKDGILNLTIGKYKYGDENLLKNLHSFLTELENVVVQKKGEIKGKYIKKAYLSLGGVKKSFSIDLNSLSLKSNTYFGKNIVL